MEYSHCWDELISERERILTKNYETDRAMGTRPALVFIDLYRKVFGNRRQKLEDAVEHTPSSCGEAGWDSLSSIVELLEIARGLGIPIVHTTGEDRSDAQIGNATLRTTGRSEEASTGLEFFDPVKPLADEYVVRKSRASAFFGTPLTSWLRLHDIDTLVIAGETTSGCVRATVVDAYSHGLKVMVCEEAVFDRSPLSHKIGLFDMHYKYATVVHLVRAVEYLQAAGSGEALIQ